MVRAVFLVLVVVTVAAFFVTQSLKTEEPLVLRFAVAQPEVFSPNGDRVGDSLAVGFDLSRPAEITFSVIDSEGEEVRRLVDDRPLAGDTKHRFRWDGRDDEGAPVPDGIYRLRVVRRQEGRVVDSFKEVRVDTRPPRVALDSAEPGVVDPGDGDVGVRVRYSGPQNANPEFRVYRTEGGPVRIVRRFRGDGTRSGVWDGSVISGEHGGGRQLRLPGAGARRGRQRDARPEAGAHGAHGGGGRGHHGAAAHAAGPAGGRGCGHRRAPGRGPHARAATASPSRGWAPAATSAATAAAAARCACAYPAMPAPASTSCGCAPAAAAPCGRWRWRAVRPARAANRPRPLVVLPTVTWQGLNDWDSDLDGFGDTLDSARSIPDERPFADRGLPPRFASEVSPLLRFLDRERLAYDLTTDLSLARREGPSLGNAPGVAVAGTSIWLPAHACATACARRSRSNGLKVVSFGRQSLRRTVALVGDRLQDASPPRPDDLFGERTERLSVRPARAAGGGGGPARAVRGRGRALRRVRGVRALGVAAARRAAAHGRRTGGGRARLRGLPTRQGGGHPARHPAAGRASWRRAG